MALDKALLDDAAAAAAVPPKERTPADLQAVAGVLESIRWFQVNCRFKTALLKLSKYIKRKQYATGEVLYEHGANARSMYVVLSGSVVLQQPGGKVVARMGAGATLGERALMGDMDELMENVRDEYGSDSDQEAEVINDASKRYCTALATSELWLADFWRDKFYSIQSTIRHCRCEYSSNWCDTFKKKSLLFRVNEDRFTG